MAKRSMSTSTSAARKVAEVTIGFWLAKIVATTLGEVAGDALAQTLNLGYIVSVGITMGLLVLLLFLQTMARGYHPLLFWAAIVGTTTAGTEIADLFTHTLGIGYLGTSAIFFAGMLLALGAWFAARRTCSPTRWWTGRTKRSSGLPCYFLTAWGPRSAMASSMFLV